MPSNTIKIATIAAFASLAFYHVNALQNTIFCPPNHSIIHVEHPSFTCNHLSVLTLQTLDQFKKVNHWLDCDKNIGDQYYCRPAKLCGSFSQSGPVNFNSTCREQSFYRRVGHERFTFLNPSVNCTHIPANTELCFSDLPNDALRDGIRLQCPDGYDRIAGGNYGSFPCEFIAEHYELTLDEFKQLNPQLDCSAPIAESYCAPR